jgi:predicted  nucleic acid-binding Zn-ribbon protein
VYEKEFQEIKARSEEVKRVLGPYMQNWIEKDIPKLFAEIEKLRTEQELLRRNIQILKDEFSTRITKADERVRGIEASQAAMREVQKYVGGKLGSLNIGESQHKIDLPLSTSAPSHPQTKRRSIPLFIEYS